MNKLNNLIIQTLPLFFSIALSFFAWRYNNLLLILYLIIFILLIITGKDTKIELQIFIYGCLAGFLVETIGTQVSGYQSFTLPQVFGIPYWLIVVWGYGFVLMKRISLVIATGTPWLIK